MTIEEAYLKLTNKVEKNIVNDGMSLDKARFVLLFNEAQNKFVEHILDGRIVDVIQYIQALLKSGVRIKPNNTLNDSVEFGLPKDFFYFVNVSAKGGGGKCKDVSFHLWQAKHENVHELLHDEFNRPSLKYAETFYTIGNNSIRIFTDGFTIDKVFLDYYRYPKQVDIAGYIRADGTSSSSIDPEFDDKIVDRILSICAKDFNHNERYLDTYQTDMNQVASKI